MTRFSEILSAVSSIALAGLPLFAIGGIAHLQALMPAVGI